MDTKEKILVEALKLFAVNGYDATSIRAIAGRVGVANSALYKHYKSKQDIFCAIVERCKMRFMDASRTMSVDTDKSLDEIKRFCLDMYRFQTEDEWITLFRQLLLVEQFKNESMRRTYHTFFVEMPVEKMAAIFAVLIERGIMKNTDTRLLAAQLYAPFYLHHLDEPPERREIMAMLKMHADAFYDENLIK